MCTSGELLKLVLECLLRDLVEFGGGEDACFVLYRFSML